MNSRFPVYAKHDDADCFMCRQKLTGPVEDSGFPPRYGQYRRQCSTPGCYQHTYYDLKEAYDANAPQQREA